MSRLKHSPAGYLRRLQISTQELFAFVEGTDIDPYFYGQVCGHVCRPRGIGYRVRPARELPTHSGGKLALVSFYRYARSRGALVSTLGGKRTVIVFFMDKDVDDLQRKKCRSPHVIYTRYYDVENCVFRHSDFIRGVSCAASLDPTELAEHPLFAGNWCRSAVQRWKEWVICCLLSTKFKLPGSCYGVVSRINVPLNAPTDQNRYNDEIEKARAHLNAEADYMRRAVVQASKLVQAHLSRGTYDRVFKGKWYAIILERDLSEAIGRGMNGFARRAVVSLGGTLDFSEPWAEHFTEPLIALLKEPPPQVRSATAP